MFAKKQFHIFRNSATPARGSSLLWHLCCGRPAGYIQSKEWLKDKTKASLFAGAIALELSEGAQLEACQSCQNKNNQ